MAKIIISAPGKLMLFGEHAVVYGKPCMVTAVDQRMRATVTLLDRPVLQIDSPDVGISSYEKPLTHLNTGVVPKGVRFVEAAVANMFERYSLNTGIQVQTSSDFSSTVGFGSSSASTVCVVKALSELFALRMTNTDMFDVCYKTVLDIQGVGSGFDVASAIYGGTIYFVTPGKTIESLPIGALPLVIGYTGVKADTATIVKDLITRYEGREDERDTLFDQIAEIVEPAKNAITHGTWDVAGNLMNKNQRVLETLGVSSTKLNDMITAARSAGAYGAKLSGAGVGDCMIALVSEEKRIAVEKAIISVNGEIIHVKSNAEGVRGERI